MAKNLSTSNVSNIVFDLNKNMLRKLSVFIKSMEYGYLKRFVFFWFAYRNLKKKITVHLNSFVISLPESQRHHYYNITSTKLNPTKPKSTEKLRRIN